MFNKSQEKRREELLANPIEISGIERQLDIHQIELLPVNGDAYTAGSIAFFTKSHSKSEWQPVQLDGAAYVLTVVAAPDGVRSFELPNGSIYAIRAEPTELAYAGVETHWSLNVISGRKG